jgi:hypothetical protein
MTLPSQRSLAYDHPTYITRQSIPLGATTAGAGALSQKFVAFAAMQIYSVTATCVASGTSTYASLWNGTATVATAVGAQTFSVIRLINGAAAGASPSLTTATYGPFALSLYNGTLTGTQTNSSLPGFTNHVPLYGTATTGTAQAGAAAANGGVSINPGDLVWVVQGTDATATGAYTLEACIAPGGNLTV